MIYTISFADRKVSIDCRHSDAEQIVTFLFPEAKKEISGKVEPVFLLKTESSKKRQPFLFYRDGQKTFSTSKTGVMAARVLDAVVSWFAGECRVGPTLHAAALLLDEQSGVLFPGKSGSGKSTLSAWMTLQGYGYLTDELACLPGHSQDTLLGFQRPIHLKNTMAEYFEKQVRSDPEKTGAKSIWRIQRSDWGLLIPAGQINPDAAKIVSSKPLVAAIIFPKFQKDTTCLIEPISSARSFARIMGTVVNARNFDDHAVKSVAQLTRDIPSFSLVFGQLEAILPNLEPIIQKALKR